MAKTSLIVRDGNRDSDPTFLFSIWGHPRIPRVSKDMDGSCRREKATTVREPGNEHDRSASNAVMQSKYATE